MFKTKSFFGWLCTAALVGICAFFLYKFYTFQPRGPDELKTEITRSQVRTAQAIAQAQVARLSRRMPPPPQAACRQLPVRINRANLTFWGKDAQNQPVQLQQPYFGCYSGEEVYGIVDLVTRFIEATPAIQDAPMPPEAAALHLRLQKARERIVSLADVPCAYEWDVVRSIVLSQGDQLILQKIGEVSPLRDYDARKRVTSIYQQAKRIPPEEAEKMSDLALTLQMVENATALIFARTVTILSGYTPDELDALRTICVPFNISYVGYEKAAMIWNRGRVLAFIQNTLSEEERFANRKGLKAVEDVDHGSPTELISQMVASVDSKEPTLRYMESQLKGHVDCDFPPVLNGPERGARVLLDALNDPMINFVNVATSEQSRLAMSVH